MMSSVATLLVTGLGIEPLILLMMESNQLVNTSRPSKYRRITTV